MRRTSLLVCVVVVLALSAHAQVTLSSLKTAFGRPVANVFTVAPDMFITASYDAHHNFCSLIIAPDKPTMYPDAKAMSGRLHAVLDKAVPADVRGDKSEFEMITINGCAGWKETRYRNVSIGETIFSDVNASCTTQMQMKIRFIANHSCREVR